MTSEEKYIQNKLNGIKPTCKCGCGMPVKYRDSYKGFTKFYSYECRSKYNKEKNNLKKHCLNCGKYFKVPPSRDKLYCSRQCAGASELTKKNRKKFNLEKYGTEYISSVEEVKDKIKKSNSEKNSIELKEIQDKRKKTVLEKYGTNHPLQSNEVKEKIKKTNLERYGTEYGFQSEEVKEKIKKSNREKYGVDHPLMNKELKEKAKVTLAEKYGVDNISKSDEIKELKGQKSLEKYGTDSVLQAPEIKEKIKNTLMEKYGVENISHNEEFLNRRAQTRLNVFYNRLKENNWFNETVELITPIEEYKGRLSNGIYNKYKFKCNTCSTEFEYALRDGRIPRCPNCNPPDISLAEKEISSFIKSHNIEVIENDKSILDGLELDIYIPSHNLAIEYNGLYWHSESNNKDKNYHLNKTKLCNKKGIRLIHIFEDEWLNKREIVESKLLSILGLSDEKIYARNTEVRELSPKEKNEFLENYHIQGKDSSSIKLGLYYNNELVSLMTFSKPRISLGQKDQVNNIWEISRFCSSKQVIGGASKLFKYFIRTYDPKKVYSYADIRWTDLNNNLYESMGFKLEGISEPNYWYVNKNGINRYHRFGFRKNILKERLDSFDEKLTEWENMQINDYDRIWDCGNLKYIHLKN